MATNEQTYASRRAAAKIQPRARGSSAFADAFVEVPSAEQLDARQAAIRPERRTVPVPVTRSQADVEQEPVSPEGEAEVKPLQRETYQNE